MDPDKIMIRSFRPEDREEVRLISCQTAFLEIPVEKFLNDKEILADALTQYYTDHEPASCFVATFNGKIVGYLLGARDVLKVDVIFRSKIMLPFIMKILKSGVLFSPKTLKLLFYIAISAIKGEFWAPRFVRQYPATLHVNIDKDFRRFHIGSQLIDHYLNFLRSCNVEGVHFGTISDGAKIFFLKKGFALLHQNPRSYLKYITGKSGNYYIFGKIIL